MKYLLGLSLAELKDIVKDLGMPAFTAKQICEWLYKKQVKTIEEMTNISKANRQKLAELYEVGRQAPKVFETSVDGTRKYLFEVEKGMIEAVFIPDKNRATLCISSQVGCKMDCLFCMTGKQGFTKQLTKAEIINQILSVEEAAELTNIVYMGMGEPLDNTDNVLSTIEVLTADWGLAWSPKRITLSTIGVKKGLERFLNETKCHLAVSLHNPFSEERKEIMPIEKAMPLNSTIEMIRNCDFSGQRRVSFEYIVFDELNDTKEHAKELGKLLRNIPCRINLIPFHQIPNVPLRPSSKERISAFKSYLEAQGYTTTVRTSRGEDISAACGMLSTKEQMKKG